MTNTIIVNLTDIIRAFTGFLTPESARSCLSTRNMDNSNAVGARPLGAREENALSTGEGNALSTAAAVARNRVLSLVLSLVLSPVILGLEREGHRPLAGNAALAHGIEVGMLIVVQSNKSVQEIEKTFPEVAARHRFGVLGVYNLRQKLQEKGVPFDRECLVFEVCNPILAKKVLDDNIAISTALPCRISVYQEGGTTKIATIKPTMLLGLFPNPELAAVAAEVEGALIEIMKELA